MADKPKAPSVISNEDALSRLAVMLLVLLVLAGATTHVNEVLTRVVGEEFSVSEIMRVLFFDSPMLISIFNAVKVPFVLTALGLSALAMVALWWVNKKTRALRTTLAEERALYEKKMVSDSLSQKNMRWEHVLTLAASDSPGDWRSAIIEADIMLDELLASMGHQGQTLGDKLKGVELADMKTLDMAWDGHKVRNRIAHSGSDFILTERETKRVVDLYRQVFEEFDYI